MVFWEEIIAKLFHNPLDSPRIHNSSILHPCRTEASWSSCLVGFLLRFWILWTLQSVRFVFHQIYKSISTEIVGKSNKVYLIVYRGRSERPYTSVWIKSNRSLPLSIFPLKGAFVILPSKQNSHSSSDFKSNDCKIPSDWSLAVRFLFIWPRWWCHYDDLSNSLLEEPTFRDTSHTFMHTITRRSFKIRTTMFIM